MPSKDSGSQPPPINAAGRNRTRSEKIAQWDAANEKKRQRRAKAEYNKEQDAKADAESQLVKDTNQFMFATADKYVKPTRTGDTEREEEEYRAKQADFLLRQAAMRGGRGSDLRAKWEAGMTLEALEAEVEALAISNPSPAASNANSGKEKTSNDSDEVEARSTISFGPAISAGSQPPKKASADLDRFAGLPPSSSIGKRPAADSDDGPSKRKRANPYTEEPFADNSTVPQVARKKTPVATRPSTPALTRSDNSTMLDGRRLYYPQSLEPDELIHVPATAATLPDTPPRKQNRHVNTTVVKPTAQPANNPRRPTTGLRISSSAPARADQASATRDGNVVPRPPPASPAPQREPTPRTSGPKSRPVHPTSAVQKPSAASAPSKGLRHEPGRVATQTAIGQQLMPLQGARLADHSSRPSPASRSAQQDAGASQGAAVAKASSHSRAGHTVVNKAQLTVSASGHFVQPVDQVARRTGSDASGVVRPAANHDGVANQPARPRAQGGDRNRPRKPNHREPNRHEPDRDGSNRRESHRREPERREPERREPERREPERREPERREPERREPDRRVPERPASNRQDPARPGNNEPDDDPLDDVDGEQDLADEDDPPNLIGANGSHNDPTVAILHNHKAILRSFATQTHGTVRLYTQRFKAKKISRGSYTFEDNQPGPVLSSDEDMSARLWAWAARKHHNDYPHLLEHMKHGDASVTSTRTGLKNSVEHTVFIFWRLFEKTPEEIQALVKDLLPNKFHQRLVGGGTEPFGNGFIEEACLDAFFDGPTALGIKYPMYFRPVPWRVLALMATLANIVITSWSDGTYKRTSLDVRDQVPLFRHYLQILVDTHEHQPVRLERVCLSTYDRGLARHKKAIPRSPTPEPPIIWAPDTAEKYVSPYKAPTAAELDDDVDMEDMEERAGPWRSAPRQISTPRGSVPPHQVPPAPLHSQRLTASAKGKARMVESSDEDDVAPGPAGIPVVSRCKTRSGSAGPSRPLRSDPPKDVPEDSDEEPPSPRLIRMDWNGPAPKPKSLRDHATDDDDTNVGPSHEYAEGGEDGPAPQHEHGEAGLSSPIAPDDPEQTEFQDEAEYGSADGGA